MSTKKRDPFVLVTINGGVASVQDYGGATHELVDFDNWEQDDMVIGELMNLMDIAARIPITDEREALIREIGEIADKGLNYDDLNDQVGGFEHDAIVADAAKALRFFGFDEAADDLEGRHEEIKDKLACAQLAKKRRKK